MLTLGGQIVVGTSILFKDALSLLTGVLLARGPIKLKSMDLCSLQSSESLWGELLPQLWRRALDDFQGGRCFPFLVWWIGSLKSHTSGFSLPVASVPTFLLCHSYSGLRSRPSKRERRGSKLKALFTQVLTRNRIDILGVPFCWSPRRFCCMLRRQISRAGETPAATTASSEAAARRRDCGTQGLEGRGQRGSKAR